jgi:V/A-type H+-transporting ATPase subunit F
MYKIAVMGDKDSVLGFKALGLNVFACDILEAKELLEKLAKQEYAIIYITEQLAAQMKTEIENYSDMISPAIILIPSKDGALGIGMDNVRACIERAVGSDILQNG